MRACATASAVFSGFAIAAATFLACSSGTGTPQPPPNPESSAPTSVTIPTASAALSATASAAASQSNGEAETAHCKQVLADTNGPLPEGGVVMNNAMTSADAGSSDRFRAVYELIATKKEGFRCCFDIWAKNNLGVRGKIGLKVELKPDGTVSSASLDPAQTDVHDPRVEACTIDLAKSLSYPKSPGGKITTFTYPFDFKPHR